MARRVCIAGRGRVMNDLPARKQNRIEQYDYSSPGAYFVTVCTAGREKVFWNETASLSSRRGELCSPTEALPLSEAGKIVDREIQKLNSVYPAVTVDKYCIMPDHIHMIIRISGNENGRILSAPTLSTVVGQMKRWASKHIGHSVWQKSFHDHAVRNRADYEEIWRYIDENPLKYL